VQSYGDKVNSWFSEAIGRPCTFVRCSSSKYRSCTINGRRDRLCRDTRSKLSFVNEGQLLLVSEDSISDLNSRLSSSTQFLFPLFHQKEKWFLFCALCLLQKHQKTCDYLQNHPIYPDCLTLSVDKSFFFG